MHAFLVTDAAREGAANEDAVARTRAAAVLVDGAGIPPRYRRGCRHPVAWFAEHLAAALAGRLEDLGRGMREAAASAILDVRALHERGCDLGAGGPSGTVVAVRRRGDVLEHLILADSSLLITRADGVVRRLTDDRLEEVLRRETAADAIEAMRNREGGFWVARHEPEAADRALVGSIPVREVAHLSLVSDGITRAVDMLGLEDDARLARSCRDEASARALVARIRDAERTAAAAGTLPARKVHDDATVLTLAMSGGAHHRVRRGHTT